ncbi:hypothetical protein A3731_24645 [Roseovarius sp. HI0049]|nr:hypothetical protein A3731_24645 [Roseovarius sp. HI0049]
MTELAFENVEAALSGKIMGGLISTFDGVSVDVLSIAQAASTGNEKGGFFPPFPTAGMPKMSLNTYVEQEASKAFMKRKIAWVLEVTQNQKQLHRLAPAVVNILAFYFYNPKWGYAYPGIPRIAEELGAGKNGVMAAIKSLEEQGHLNVERRGYRSSRYRWIIKGDTENAQDVLEDDEGAVVRKVGSHEPVVVQKVGSHEPVVVRKVGSHDAANASRYEVVREVGSHDCGGENAIIPLSSGKSDQTWSEKSDPNPCSEPCERGRDAYSVSPSITVSPSSTVVGDSSICDAEDKEERLLEGAALPSATGAPCDGTTPPAAPDKDHLHPENPSPSDGSFSAFWQAYPKCWPGAGDPFSGESLDEQIEAQAAWVECEGDGDDPEVICAGTRAFAAHFERVAASGRDRGGWPTPSDFLRDELWTKWLAKPADGEV